MTTALSTKTKKFRKNLETLPREDLIEIIKAQDIETYKQINRIEWVFQNKLKHLTWADGEQITERPLTNKELSLLIDEPFEIDNDLLEMRNFCRATKANTCSKRPLCLGKKLSSSRNKSLPNSNIKRSFFEKSLKSRSSFR